MELLSIDFRVTMFNTLKEIKDNLNYTYQNRWMRFEK